MYNFVYVTYNIYLYVKYTIFMYIYFSVYYINIYDYIIIWEGRREGERKREREIYQLFKGRKVLIGAKL